MKVVKFYLIVKVFLVGLCILFLMGFVSPLVTTRYDLEFDNLPEEFDGYRVLQITDFHCKEFGEKEEKLIKNIKNTNPDIILLTGDFVDESHTVDNARYLLEGITPIAPVYFVTGNHEYYPNTPYYEFVELCDEFDVRILDNESVPVYKDGAQIMLSGLDWNNAIANIKDTIGYANADYFNMLMVHNSSKFNYFAEYDYDLIFAGHGHGGLMRIPFLGGVFGTNGDFFPTYDYGIFKYKNSELVSSSGLGDARIPRWNNPREIVLVTLHSK